MLKNRYLSPALERHLTENRQMVFLTGPRQSGKTILAKSLLEQTVPNHNYFNWDLPAHRKFLMTKIFPGEERLDQPTQSRICFDEIHKYKKWKNTLKGLFDLYEPDHSHWIVTGSAVLNVYRKGQDSLLGRHFTYHLFPFSVAECLGRLSPRPLDKLLAEAFAPLGKELVDYQELLFELNGFPEPLFKGKKAFLSQWRSTRLDRLIHQDLASMENLRNLSQVENLMYLLPEGTGNPLSINSLREDLEVHFTTVKHWLTLLERVFYGFRIKCYSKKLPRLLKKEAKWYLWDWSEIRDPGARFENMVALHLNKYISFHNDQGLEDLELHYLKDRQHREVDFLLCSGKQPALAIECKLSDSTPSKQLAYFARCLPTIKRCILLVRDLKAPKKVVLDGVAIDVVPSASFLGQLV